MRFSLILLQLDLNCAWQNVLHFLEGRGEGPELTKPVLLTLEMLCSSYSLFFPFETKISIKSFEKLFSFSQFFKKHSQKFPCHHLYCFCPLYSDIIDWVHLIRYLACGINIGIGMDLELGIGIKVFVEH